MKQALIDIGSNSIRLSVYEIIDGSSFRILFKEKIMAGLAGYVDEGFLIHDGIACAISAIKEFQKTLNVLQIDDLSVFATASLRNITNTEEAIEEIRQETGISIDVISGQKEAMLGYAGAIRDIPMDNGICIDIGGASTELVVFSDGSVSEADSLPFGSLKLYRDCVSKIIPGEKSLKRMHKMIRNTMASHTIRECHVGGVMLCTGGTARACRNLISKLYPTQEKSNTFTIKQLDHLYDILCEHSQRTIELILKNEPSRIHTIVPGICILHDLMHAYQMEEAYVSTYGVREGYLLNMMKQETASSAA